MKISVKLFLIVIIAAAASISCEGDYRQLAKGDFGDAVVLMDSTQWDSRTANAIRTVYGGGIETLPNVEPRFDLTFRDFSNNEELERLKERKNIIIAAPINDESNVGEFVRALLSDEVETSVRNGEAFAFPFEDKWYRDQWSIVLTAPTDSLLAQKIRASDERLVQSLLEKEFKRWEYEIYDRGEQYALEQDSLWEKYGWKVRIQHDYAFSLDTTWVEGSQKNHFLTMRRVLPDNDRLFWAWWKEGVNDISYLDNNWINQKRDSLMKVFIRGTRDSSYVTTEYRRPVETTSFELDGDIAHETLGTWRMTHDAMGGQFVNLTVYDDETRRLFMIEYWQFAPRYRKRRFRRQFRAMVRTFESDSTWNQSQQAATN